MTARWAAAVLLGLLLAPIGTAGTAAAVPPAVAAPADPGPPQPTPDPAPGATPQPSTVPVPNPSPGTSPDPDPSPSRPAAKGPGPPISQQPGGGTMPPADQDGDGSSWGWLGYLNIPGLIAKALAAFLGVLIEQAQGPVLEALGSTLLATPNVAANPELVELWTASLGTTIAAYVLFVLVGGVLVMGHETVQTRHALKQIAPRLVIGMVAAVSSLTVMSQTIALANAGSVAIMGSGVNSKGIAQQLANAVIRRFATGDTTYLLVLELLLLVLMFGVLVGYVLRVALIYILAVSAPVALACHGLPVTDGVARLWWRGYFGCLAMQLAQSTTFIVGLRLFFAEDNTVAGFGFPRASNLGNLLAGLCLFWILWKIPSWTARVIFRSTPVSLPGTPMPLRMLRSLAIAYVLRGAFPGARTGRTGRPPTGGGPRARTRATPRPPSPPGGGPPPGGPGPPPAGGPNPGGGAAPTAPAGGPHSGPGHPAPAPGGPAPGGPSRGSSGGPSGSGSRPGSPGTSGPAGGPGRTGGHAGPGNPPTPASQSAPRPRPRSRQTALPIPARRVPARPPRAVQLRLPLELPPARRNRER